MALDLSFHHIRSLRVASVAPDNSNNVELEVSFDRVPPQSIELYGLPREQMLALVRALADDNTYFHHCKREDFKEQSQ